MALDISAETPRVQYTVTSADSTFDYDFEIFQDSDIKVFGVVVLIVNRQQKAPFGAFRLRLPIVWKSPI